MRSHAGLSASCGDDPGAVCDWVHDRTGNGRLAGAADWFIGRPLTIVLILAVGWAITRITRRVVRKTMIRVAESSVVRDPRSSARATSISGAVASALAVVIWLIAVILVLGQLGIDLAPLIAGAGIAGVAIGFGAQSLVRDCLSGLFMIVEDQFGVGDVIDLGEPKGVVERITLRTTVLRDQDGTVWHVPNGSVQRVGNRSQLWSMALVDVVVPPAVALDDAKAALLTTAAEVSSATEFSPVVIAPPELLGVESLTVDSATLRLRVKTTPGQQFGVQRALREGVKRRLDELVSAAAS